MDRLAELLRAAEVLGDLHDVAVLGDRRHLQHVRQDELRGAVLRVLLE